MVVNGITLSGVTVTIEYDVADGTRGASWDDPYTLDDLVDTIANVTKQGNQIYNPYQVLIQDVTTYFLAEDMDVFCCVTTNAYGWYVYDHVNFKSLKMTWRTINNRKLWWSRGTITIEDTMIIGFINIWIYGYDNIEKAVVKRVTILNCNSLSMPYAYPDCVEVEDLILNNVHWKPWYSFISATNIQSINCLSAPLGTQRIQPGEIVTFMNLKIKDVSAYDIMFDLYYPNQILNLIDCEIDLTNYDKYTLRAGNNYTTCSNKTTLNVTIDNGSGGTITIYDQNDNVVFTETLGSDDMTEQIITFEKRYLEETDGVEDEDTYTQYEPFKIVVIKSGYQDLEITGITITPGEQTDIFGKLRVPLYIEKPNVINITTEVHGVELESSDIKVRLD